MDEYESKSNLKATRRLVRGLMSRYLGERIQAQDRLKELGPQAVDALLALIQSEQKKLRIRRRIFYGIAGSFAFIGLPLMAYLIYRGILIGGPTGSGMIGGALGGILGGWGGGLVSGNLWLLFPSPTQIAASSALALVEDTRAVGPLAEVVVSKVNPSMDGRISAAVALLKLLPLVDQEQYDQLTPRQRSCLYRLLREPHVSRETELSIVVLQSIERVGDSAAFSAVARLAESGEVPERCHAAAVNCFNTLLANRENSTAAESLVRPARAPTTDSLLRAAHTTPESPESVLLRASDSHIDH